MEITRNKKTTSYNRTSAIITAILFIISLQLLSTDLTIYNSHINQANVFGKQVFPNWNKPINTSSEEKNFYIHKNLADKIFIPIIIDTFLFTTFGVSLANQLAKINSK